MSVDPRAVLRSVGIATDHQPVALSGGDTGRVFRLGPYVVKTHPDPPPGLFAAEARGLGQLAGAGVAVPGVVGCTEAGLVLEWLGEGPGDWPALGRTVAELHRDTLEPSGRYGSEQPVFLGTFRCPAGEGPWPRIFLEHRLSPLLQATRSALGTRAPRLEAWMASAQLPIEGSCLVHGDLWSGNVHFGVRGPALIDPSAQRAERGLDLAMMQLFGGFPQPFWRAYEAVLPIPGAVREAISAYQLYYLLLHLHSFGRGYLGAIDQALAALPGR